MAKLLNIYSRNHGRVFNKLLHILPGEQAALRVGSRNVQSAAGLTPKLQSFIEKNVALCQPDKVHICDGSEAENQALISTMVKLGTLEPLPKYKNCWLARTDPGDVARVESRTFMSTENKSDTVPSGSAAKSTLGNWISPDDLNKAVQDRFPGCMKGRTMYVVPFSMGPLGSPLAKLGVELTDSPYVAASMRIMTRMGAPALQAIRDGADFIRCLHSVGRSTDPNNPWPCEPEKTIIAHKVASSEIISYGSGYGGNSLLGKKCLALRIGSTVAKREGWLAEHMLILGITNPKGVKRYIAAAFPSACGKTNLAMLTPTLPGYKVECVGDDIAWMKFDSQGRLRAINPENGFFGVAPGTSYSTNPNAMKTIFENSVFTNVAKTSDGGVYWEGMDELDSNVQVTDWRGQPWTKDSGKNAAHPNSRFCSPAGQCPIIDPAWESPEGVPIDAILFGGRRPQGVPLVYEAFDWKHGVFIGAAMRSEATAAAEFKGKVIMHDPFAMRPFFGYNFGHYLDHWLSLEKTPGRKLPKIFHVNWFRKSEQGKFLWPGFGDNVRVLEWVLNRLDGNDSIAEKSAIGYIPSEGALNLEGLSEPINTKELFSVPKEFWLSEVEQIKKYFEDQVGSDLPNTIAEQLHQLRNRVDSM